MFVDAGHVERVQQVAATQGRGAARRIRQAAPGCAAGDGLAILGILLMLALTRTRDPVEILENGTLVVNYGQSWKGSYAPSIDQIAANAARIYRERCGLIIFTGMGDDGAASCRLIKQVGGKVWAQSPSDCTSDSMPVSALATGCVSLTGTPEYLARALVQTRQTTNHN